MRVIGEIAQRLVDVINESLKIAADSANRETRASRLEVAKLKLREIKELASQYSFLTFQSLPEVERDIGILEQELEITDFRANVEANSCARQLEKAGSIDEATAQLLQSAPQRLKVAVLQRLKPKRSV
jgi:arginine utilization protein RocB